MKGKSSDEISELFASGKPIPESTLKHLIPEKYASIKESPEKAAVKAGEPNVIDFKLMD